MLSIARYCAAPTCWVLIFSALMHFLLAVGNASEYINSFTRFSGETFGTLIALLFAQAAVKGLVDEFKLPEEAPVAYRTINGLWSTALAVLLVLLSLCLMGRGRGLLTPVSTTSSGSQLNVRSARVLCAPLCSVCRYVACTFNNDSQVTPSKVCCSSYAAAAAEIGSIGDIAEGEGLCSRARASGTWGGRRSDTSWRTTAAPSPWPSSRGCRTG